MYKKPLVTACFILAIVSSSKSARDVPPRITSKFPKEVAYKEYERAELACEAQGGPAPSFEWKKDGELLSVTAGQRIRWTQPSSGTIAIDGPTSLDEGIYQCFARNAWGTAVGRKILFKRAVLEPFPSVKQPKLHYPTVGSKFTLQCTPPLSYPEGLIYWGENKPNSRLKPIENTARVSLDYSGNLHFANIRPEDSRNGFSYACILENSALRSLVQGDDQIISPVNVTTVEPRYAQPTLMWSSSTSPIAISGETMKMKCIFAGYPTPEVRWERVIGQMPSSAQLMSFGQELVIRSVQFDDEGSYRCSANNSDTGSPVVQDFQLTVESMPYWRQGQDPEDVSVAEDEPALVSCEAYGKPKPSISWFINGLPVEELPADPRRMVTDNSISYSSITKEDKQVIQCNASNVHGYILANPYINVVAEPPSFIQTPKSVVKVAEGENVTLTCRVFGAPKPKISWNYMRTHGSDTQPITPSVRFLQQDTGDLWLQGLLKSDSGLYVCAASNKFGSDSVASEVLVRERTVITERPKNRVVNASTSVIFPCSAQTDPLESSNLVIEWHRNGKKIDFLRHPHMEHSAANNSLIIVGAEVVDSANYSCVARNGVDESVATAQLFVHGRPDPPTDVRLVNGCQSNRAELKWLPGNDNNNRITEFVVYSNTSYDPPDRFREVIRVPESLHSATVILQPRTTYSFHVTARNNVGESKRSRFTSEDAPCSTPPSAPFRHPEGVCSVSRGEDELVVVWQPMEPADHNGENFRYLVGYRLKGEDEGEFQELRVDDWRSSEAVIPKQPTFREYVIYVKAANSQGEAPSSNLKKKIGYSGQGVPLISPEKFSLVAVNSTSAEFSWIAIKEDPNKVKGFFLGYMIKFWKTADPGNFRKENLTLRSFDSCPARSKDRRRRMTDGSHGNEDLVTGRTDSLWPNSVITAVVMVMNGAGRAGPTSNSIEFQTPEGVPDAVAKFEVLERGSNHFLVSWAPPKESNGNLTGYVIEFEEAPSGVVLNRVTVDPVARKKKITGLKNDTSYIVKIRATTSTGSGPEIVLHEKTKPSSAPSKPGIADVKVGHNFVIVSFDSSTDEDNSANPGSVHCVEYRPHGSNVWLRSDNVTDGATVNVTGLDEGAAYEIRVVAFNDNERHSVSDVMVITTGQKAETGNATVVNESYLKLIVVAAVLFLIIFIVCLFCYISYSKAGIYPVNVQEKKHGCAAGKNDEPEFGEYVRPSEPLVTKSSSSISSLNEKKSPEHIDSDNDSLGEYADPDPLKFTEDGSFIGKYGKKTPTDNAKDAPVVSFSTLI